MVTAHANHERVHVSIKTRIYVPKLLRQVYEEDGDGISADVRDLGDAPAEGVFCTPAVRLSPWNEHPS